MRANPLLAVALAIASAALLALSGCAQHAIGLNPRFPRSASTAAMSVSDARTITDSYLTADAYGVMISAAKSIEPHPPQESVLGCAADTVLFLGDKQPVAKAIASIVATRFPDSRVALLDCRCVIRVGLWINSIDVYISARVERLGRTQTINAFGRNRWNNPSADNYSLGFERALDDFARQIQSAPAELQ